MQKDHWNRNTLRFLQEHLTHTTKQLQIATGFFTIQGYDLIRPYLSNINVQLMVGFDETSRERLRELLIAEIMLYISRWDAKNRREAVLDLVKRLQNNSFQIIEQDTGEWLEARTKKYDHGKVYILDQKTVIAGSPNLTVSGLRYNAENLTVIDQPKERVQYYIQQFDTFWNSEKTQDLTQLLLEALLKWLSMVTPFDIYLKTIDALIKEDDIETPRADYKQPVNYQIVVIERILRQLKTFRGAMLVASTGLGKTIMATHTALRLRKESIIYNVIIFAPKQVQPDWKYALRSAGLSHEIFTRNLLDQPSTRTGKGMLAMEDALAYIDDNYLVIIDESQYFRNRTRAKDSQQKHSFRRLVTAVNATRAKVLLLTATPYTKGIDDLNNQLHLLPHTAPKRHIDTTGQFVFEGMMDAIIAPKAWKVIYGEHFFEDFIQLPIVTVISTSQVAKDFAQHSEVGDFLYFGKQKKWIPQIEILKIKVPVYFEEHINSLFEKGVFSHKAKRFKDRLGNTYSTNKIVQNKAEIAWMSTPRAIKEVLVDVVNNKDKVKYKYAEKQRKDLIDPVLEEIEQATLQQDYKLQALVYQLKQYILQNKKAILFTERLVSAIYLEQSLQKLIPDLLIANTVKETDKGIVVKDFEKEVLQLIKGFAPIANNDKILPSDKLINYNLLIATDAYSTGVNLQDASVVINYDLAWTPDILMQRAGRILRFWENPRLITFLVFVGNFQLNRQDVKKTHNVEERLRKLSARSQEAQKFTQIPILPKADKTNIASLSSLANVTIEDIGLVDIKEIEEFTGVSPYLHHISTLKKYEDYIKTIPNDIVSVTYYKGKKQLLYLLLFYRDEYFYIIYHPEKDDLRDMKEDDLLDILKCSPDTELLAVDIDEIEKLAQRTRKKWEKQHPEILPNEVERICACLLVPKAQKTTFSSLFVPQIT